MSTRLKRNPVKEPTEFGRRLMSLVAGLKQWQAAEKLGLSRPHYCRFIYGSLKNCSAPTAVRIAQLTGCDLQWLITGVSSQPPTPPAIAKLNALLGYTDAATAN